MSSIRQILILTLITGSSLTSAAWSNSIPEPTITTTQTLITPSLEIIYNPTFTAKPELPPQTPTPTPLPPEWEENSELTNGIIFGGVMLVLIIVGGTIRGIRQKNNSIF